MLLLGSKLIDMPILSLQTGGRLATTKKAVINPADLKVLAYEVAGPRLNQKPSFLRIADIREISPIGIIVDSNEELVGLDDVILIKKIINLDFNLLGIKIINQQKSKIGVAIDYIIDSDSLYIKKIRVKQTFLKSLNKTELLIDRTQIVEISNDYIMVKDGLSKVKIAKQMPKAQAFVNPFRSKSPQTQTKEQPGLS